MKSWHRLCIGLLSLAVTVALTWVLLSLPPLPGAVPHSYLPLQWILVNLIFNPLLAN